MLFSVLLISSIVFGCVGDTNIINHDSEQKQQDESTDKHGSKVAVTNAEDLVSSHLEDLPKADFQGADFIFLVVGEKFDPYWQSREIFAENEIAEPINDAVYRRNRIIENNYNIEIKEIRSDGTMASIIRNYIASNDTGYDIMMPPLNMAAQLSREKLFEDFNNIENLDREMPWWDHMVKNDLSFGDKQYFIIGDISILDKEATRAIYFSKKLIKDYNLESPYELVIRNEWTYDKLGEMAKKVKKDLNGDSVIDELDQFGIISEIGNSLNFINAFGGRLAPLDENGVPRLAIIDEHTLDLFTKANELLYDTDLTFTVASTISKMSKSYSDIWDITINMFSEDRALFLPIGLNALRIFRTKNTDFGLLPNPKYDETVSEYYSPIYTGAPATVCFPVNNSENNNAGLIAEALCAESYITLKPAYYDICLKGKYIRDNESEGMLDIIFKNRIYDIGVIYNLGKIRDMFNILVNKKSSDIMSEYKKIEKAVQADLDALLR